MQPSTTAATTTTTTTADEIEATAHEKIAEGHALLARARRMRTTPPADELLDRERLEADYPIRFRVVTDAARRGENVCIEHIGRKAVVRRSILEAWIASRRTAATEKLEALSPRDAARAAVAARIARSA